jgi:hypothetical protein
MGMKKGFDILPENMGPFGWLCRKIPQENCVKKNSEEEMLKGVRCSPGASQQVGWVRGNSTELLGLVRAYLLTNTTLSSNT